MSTQAKIDNVLLCTKAIVVNALYLGKYMRVSAKVYCKFICECMILALEIYLCMSVFVYVCVRM